MATETPAKVEAAVRAAVRGASSVHLVSRATESGKTETEVVDAGRTEGRLTLHVAAGTGTILALKKAAYLKADAGVLSTVFGLSGSEESKAVGRWLSFPAGTTGYEELTGGLTTGSIAKETALTSVTRKANPDIDGTKVVALHGHAASSKTTLLTLYVPKAGPALPIKGTITAKGLSATLSFSNWGKPVTVTAPAKSTTFKG